MLPWSDPKLVSCNSSYSLFVVIWLPLSAVLQAKLFWNLKNKPKKMCTHKLSALVVVPTFLPRFYFLDHQRARETVYTLKCGSIKIESRILVQPTWACSSGAAQILFSAKCTSQYLLGEIVTNISVEREMENEGRPKASHCFSGPCLHDRTDSNPSDLPQPPTISLSQLNLSSTVILLSKKPSKPAQPCLMPAQTQPSAALTPWTRVCERAHLSTRCSVLLLMVTSSLVNLSWMLSL